MMAKHTKEENMSVQSKMMGRHKKNERIGLNPLMKAMAKESLVKRGVSYRIADMNGLKAKCLCGLKKQGYVNWKKQPNGRIGVVPTSKCWMAFYG